MISGGRRHRLVIGLCLILAIGMVTRAATVDSAAPQPDAQLPAATDGRTMVVISDLHFGLGRTRGTWHRLEDFRWSRALAGFLDAIGKQYHDRVDLIIAGDLLELWQHPDVPCAGAGADYGCTTAEVLQIAQAVLHAHQVDLRTLRQFAARGENQVIVIPGNHDAGLLIDAVAQALITAIDAPPGKVTLVKSGRWFSPGRLVIVEHGHQIGEDPNRFARWPVITTPISGQDYLDRPWGEQFVQKLYNDVEDTEPLIDNLLPLSKGIEMYASRRGTVGTALDIGRFLVFHVFETSFAQQRSLGGDRDAGAPANEAAGRKLGYRLFANALPDADRFRESLLRDKSDRWNAIRADLDRRALDPAQLGADDVIALCEAIALRQKESAQPREDCGHLGGSLGQSLFPIDRVIARHLRSLMPEARPAQVFVYGHTHAVDFDWSVKNEQGYLVSVFNTGAFQRLVDEPALRDIATTRHVPFESSLSEVPLDSLPACYPAVIVTQTAERASGRLLNWVMSEDDGASGAFIHPCDARCPSTRSQGCTHNR